MISSSTQPALAPLVVLHVAETLEAAGADAGAEVKLADVAIAGELLDRAIDDDLALLHDVAVARDRKRHRGILLDEQDRHAALLVNASDDTENLLDQNR